MGICKVKVYTLLQMAISTGKKTPQTNKQDLFLAHHIFDNSHLVPFLDKNKII